MSDRTIHATTADGGEVVRYNRAGKWYLEYPAFTYKPRCAISFGSAVELAKRRGSSLRLGLPGGSRFDAAVTRDWPA